MNAFPIISILTFLPIAGALLLFISKPRAAGQAKATALTFTLGSLVLTIFLCTRFNRDSGAIQFPEQHTWIGSLGIQYFVGADGLSLLLVLLTAIVVPMAVLAADITEGAAAYYGRVLLLQSGLFGTFTALNFFHWFIFGNSA